MLAFSAGLLTPCLYAAPVVVLFATPRVIEAAAKTEIIKGIYQRLRARLHMDEREPFPLTARARPIYQIFRNNAWLAALIMQSLTQTPLMSQGPSQLRASSVLLGIASSCLQAAREKLMDTFPEMNQPDQRVFSHPHVD